MSSAAAPKNSSDEPAQKEKTRDLTLRGVSRVYLNQLTDAERDIHAPSVAKFTRWLGDGRAVDSLSPSDVGEYSDTHYERTSTPDFTHLRHIRAFLSFVKRRRFTSVSLAHHIRLARTGRAASSKSSAAVSRETITLTPEGHQSLTAELKSLKQDMIKVAEDIKRAAADGDVRENSPLEAAREEQGRIAARITEIENTLKFASIITPTEDGASGKVAVGSRVKLLSDALSGDSSIEYQIVSTKEADPNKNKISAASPVGRALIDRQIGEKVTVNAPNGSAIKFTIKSIR